MAREAGQPRGHRKGADKVEASVGQKRVYTLKFCAGRRRERGAPRFGWNGSGARRRAVKAGRNLYGMRKEGKEMEYNEHWVLRGTHRIYVREYPGEGPTLVLMHGFPDNLHLYDRLVPHLAGRGVVVFDFLGWGGSDKPKGYPKGLPLYRRQSGPGPRRRHRDAGA